jgi:glucose-1-phosphate cytidylyltransferase
LRVRDEATPQTPVASCRRLTLEREDEELMKVVLFCGGAGMRIRDYSDQIPKPLVNVGQRPILWHLMKYYSHYGHKEFILCLGYGAHKIKEFFLKYDEWATNDFVLKHGGKTVEMLKTDIEDWKITFVDTGHESNVGERLRRVRRFVDRDEMFLANYADGLSDLPLDTYVDSFARRDKAACFLTVPVPQSFHVVHTNEHGDVTGLEPVTTSAVRINAGFFVLRPDVFDYMHPGEELVREPFERLIEEQRLLAYPYDGFWRAMDTFKDKVELDAIAAAGHPPWQVWDRPESESPAAAATS